MQTSNKVDDPGYVASVGTAQGDAAQVPIAAVDLSQRRGDTWVLRHLNFRLAAGEVVWLVGDNGAGKSTLLHLLAGLLRPSYGQAWAFGQPSHRLRGSQRRRLGLMGHDPFCHEALSGAANLTWAARLAGRPGAAAGARAADALAEVGLQAVAHRSVGAYSAGMRRRLALARLLLTEPQVLLVDEPFAQLDSGGQALATACLRRRLDAGATLMFTSHQAEPAHALAGRVVRLVDGQLQTPPC